MKSTEAILATLQRTDRGRQTLAALAPLAALWHTLDSEHRGAVRALMLPGFAGATPIDDHPATVAHACSAAAPGPMRRARRLKHQPTRTP